jgi:hypothetical protein
MRSLSTLALFSLVVLLAAGSSANCQQEWGSIKGQLVMENGKTPPAVKLNVNKDQDHCLSKGDIFSEEYVVNPKNKGVRYVVVWIAAEKGGKADYKTELPLHPSVKEIPANRKQVVMDQPCCKFEPHVLAMRKGQDFVGRNSAPIPHSLLIQGNNGVNLNLQLIANSGELTVEASKWKPHYYPSGISCAIHPWMQGKLFVFAHPYFAITDADGNFEIKNVPAGKLRIMMWHDSGWIVKDGELPGYNGIEITVPSGKTLDMGKVPVKAKTP